MTINHYNGKTINQVQAMAFNGGNDAIYAKRLCWKCDSVGKNLIEKKTGTKVNGDLWIFA